MHNIMVSHFFHPAHQDRESGTRLAILLHRQGHDTRQGGAVSPWKSTEFLELTPFYRHSHSTRSRMKNTARWDRKLVGFHLVHPMTHSRTWRDPSSTEQRKMQQGSSSSSTC